MHRKALIIALVFLFIYPCYMMIAAPFLVSWGGAIPLLAKPLLWMLSVPFKWGELSNEFAIWVLLNVLFWTVGVYVISIAFMKARERLRRRQVYR